MRFFDAVHAGYVHDRRTNVLSAHIAELLPQHAEVVDIGTGDGLIARKLLGRRPDLRVTALEVLVRPDGAVAYVSCDASHKVAEIQTSNWTVSRLIDAGPGADGLAWAQQK